MVQHELRVSHPQAHRHMLLKVVQLGGAPALIAKNEELAHVRKQLEESRGELLERVAQLGQVNSPSLSPSPMLSCWLTL